ncbi:MAG TPA: hypothetical protein DDW94_10510 [Deltaproteobacteria bacterium]|nr:MAG: hypothetical protein A2Z79_11865 [Deltaproteobacteria bacterium GWA2_55_82]OGQ63563.1 MAG: hypothetical protein A3I81_06055 [Deltaproteobacteria bacterium RIFCSPLOWO2_02_FULL_55_12]OIJ74944.1 MAG: hypothetical protein A2V21_312110 [Deltaproteobacteria bacterium GWC2_55_46]HBG47401.1 hypothetical protein [Deltaproteobacteria bacterium]HCY11417.1 hypothetical protein [Deltaproteobacteria bacterium]
MKRFIAFTIVVSAVFISFEASAVVNTYEVGDAAGGIATTRHNLGSTGRYTRTGSTTEICVFCHTPHHTNTENDIRPLWNRASPNLAAYTAYGTTLAGTTIATSDIGSTTLACLSCHDGVSTFDNLANAPGKNGVTLNGTSDMGWTFFDAIGVTQDFMTAQRLNIGADLSNDHPVSVPYRELVAGLRPIESVIAAIDLTTDIGVSALSFDQGNLQRNLWAVKGYISDTASIQDLLREHNGVFRVECSSCHDPHFNNKSWNEIDNTYSTVVAEQELESNGLFIRRVGGNSGSGLCRTCHNK